MNNNRNNNRRRGRGNNRQQGGQQLNRIDSRARGNAQQLLDKYKKLAHDAHLNGDRVQEEYYLQFADHYFRVLADQRLRQEESRARRDDRPQDGSDRPRYDDPRSPYDDYGYESGDDEQARSESQDTREDDRPRGSEDGETDRSDSREEDGGDRYEPADNPFVRESRPQRSAPRSRSPRRETREEVRDRDESGEADGNRSDTGLDASVLPPPIGASSADVEEEAPAKPRRRTRKPRDTDGSDESLEAVG